MKRMDNPPILQRLVNLDLKVSEDQYERYILECAERIKTTFNTEIVWRPFMRLYAKPETLSVERGKTVQLLNFAVESDSERYRVRIPKFKPEGFALSVVQSRLGDVVTTYSNLREFLSLLFDCLDPLVGRVGLFDFHYHNCFSPARQPEFWEDGVPKWKEIAPFFNPTGLPYAHGFIPDLSVDYDPMGEGEGCMHLRLFNGGTGLQSHPHLCFCFKRKEPQVLNPKRFMEKLDLAHGEIIEMYERYFTIE